MPTPYDPLRELVPANREKIYAELRERMPVYWSSVHTAWILTRYADVSAILRHPDALAFDVMPSLESLAGAATWTCPACFASTPHFPCLHVRRVTKPSAACWLRRSAECGG